MSLTRKHIGLSVAIDPEGDILFFDDQTPDEEIKEGILECIKRTGRGYEMRVSSDTYFKLDQVYEWTLNAVICGDMRFVSYLERMKATILGIPFEKDDTLPYGTIVFEIKI